MRPGKRKPHAGGREASGRSASEQKFHVQNATAEPLLQRLEGVRRSGEGWRARCPSCGGTSEKVAVRETDDRVLLKCFGGCPAIEVLQAVGLTWGAVMPPRHWPESPQDRLHARRAMREADWASTLAVLALEAKVVQIAGSQLAGCQTLSAVDADRLALAVDRIDGAAGVLIDAARWQGAPR